MDQETDNVPAAGGPQQGIDPARYQVLLAENERLRARLAEAEERARQAAGERYPGLTLEMQRDTLLMERAVYELSRSMAMTADVGAAIDHALASVGQLSDASRVYLFVFNEDRSRISNLHEWCAPGVSPQIENLQDLPASIFPWWMNMLQNWRRIEVPDVSQMPPEARASQEALEAQDVRSLLVLPFAIAGQLGGFVGFDNIHSVGQWNESSVLLLDLLTQTVGQALERDRVIRDLRARERQLSAIIEYAPIMIDAFDENGRCILWNKECERVGGVSAAEMLAAEDPLSLIYLDAEFREQIWQEIREARGTYREYEALQVDGKWRYDLWADYAVPGVGIIGFGLDISERKRMEQALRASEERYRSLVEDMPALICRFLPDGTLQYVNESYCRYFGRTREDLVGSDFLDLIPADDRDFVRRHYASLSVAEPMISYEHRVLAPDGTERWQRWIDRALFDSEGNATEFRSVGLDITERRRIEEALAEYQANLEQMVDERTSQLLAANEQLKRLSQLKDEFVANVSHEFRTPLTNLLLYIELAHKNPARLVHYLDVLRREGKRLKQILEAMIDIASLDQQARDTPSEIIRLDELLMNQTVDRQSLASEKRIAMQIEGSYDEIQIDVNRDRLARVLDIIMTNAFAYTPADGCITLSAQKWVHGDGPWACIVIGDTGLGLTAEDLTRVFERFYRGDAARRLNVPGTGLGLAIARGLIEQQGGRLEIESRGPGMGTTVTIWLPAVEPAASQVTAGSS